VSHFDSDNEIFKLAVDLVNQSNRNIFLTGKAGTGKTTFLRYIKQNSLKQTAVIAPTGVAAINAGGSTIHSFLQLPFSPYLPDATSPMHQHEATNKHTLLGKIKLNRERIKVLQQLELLIIDEISMVRCDVVDAIDVVLRHFRHRHSEPFGGVQVLAIGDLFQLPPVASDHEWNLLSSFYNSPYFFDSRVMQQAPPVHVEFEKIYRQSDDSFIELLNQVRHGNLSARSSEILKSRFQPDFRIKKDDGYIILTTHNYKADVINGGELAKLKAKPYMFKASITGEFSEKAYPADEMLQLKQGAQVMFIRNDKEKIRRYFNGKIGNITRIEGDSIFIKCKDDADEIEVQKETWENIRYSLNKQTNQLQEDSVGSFTQYPLRLAWAITIHKSQGLTFEKAVIDAGAAFAAGQVYVALSRCTSLEGIVLQSLITPNSLKSDPTIVHFSNNNISSGQLKAELYQSKKVYQQSVLTSIFDFTQIVRSCNDLKKLSTEHVKEFNEATPPWIDELLLKATRLEDVADQFKTRLKTYFLDPASPEENKALQDRTKDAVVFFVRELSDLLSFISSSPAITDSKVLAKSYNDILREVFTFTGEKKHLLEGFTGGFSIEQYYKQKRSFIVAALSVNAYATASAQTADTAHPELHYQLRQLRNRICETSNLPVYIIAATKSIDEMAEFLPQTKDELLQIAGFGKAKVEKYGEQFLQIIIAYCSKHGLSSLVHGKALKKERTPKCVSKVKPDTKSISFNLFTEGNSVADISRIRNLAVSTVEGHLAHYVENGTIPVSQLLTTEKLEFLQPFLAEYEKGTPLSPVMEKLNNKVSFSELRLAIAGREWEKSKEIA
jgi:hypothetical protein